MNKSSLTDNDIIDSLKLKSKNLIDYLNNIYTELSNDYERLYILNNNLAYEHNQLVDKNDKLTIKYNDIIKENELLKKKVNIVTDEISSLKKISLYASLNKQLLEKDNYIKVLEKRLDFFNNKNLSSPIIPNTPITDDVIYNSDHNKDIDDNQNKDQIVENGKENDDLNNDENDKENDDLNDDENEDLDEDDDNEPEIEYETIKIGKKYYYISNEDPRGIYLVIKGSSDVGDKVGEYNNDKHIFYK
jgi:hypothetical protein